MTIRVTADAEANPLGEDYCILQIHQDDDTPTPTSSWSWTRIASPKTPEPFEVFPEVFPAKLGDMSFLFGKRKETPPPKPNLTIVSALYTSIIDLKTDGSRGKDVQEVLQALVDKSEQTIVFADGTNFNDIFGDPEPYHPKVLRVEYTIGGGDKHSIQIYESAKGRRIIGDEKIKSDNSPSSATEEHLSGQTASGSVEGTCNVGESKGKAILQSVVVKEGTDKTIESVTYKF